MSSARGASRSSHCTVHNAHRASPVVGCFGGGCPGRHDGCVVTCESCTEVNHAFCTANGKHSLPHCRCARRRAGYGAPALVVRHRRRAWWAVRLGFCAALRAACGQRGRRTGLGPRLLVYPLVGHPGGRAPSDDGRHAGDGDARYRPRAFSRIGGLRALRRGSARSGAWDVGRPATTTGAGAVQFPTCSGRA
jgi:hypothetical protein